VSKGYDQNALDAASREVHMMLLREGSNWGTKACEEMGRVFMTAYRKALPSATAAMTETVEAVKFEMHGRFDELPEWFKEIWNRRIEYTLAAAPAPAEPVAVKVCKMKESNGRVTWIVFLVKADDDPFRGHQIYSSEIEGRAEYEAARLRHFFGQGPEPDILAFDTAAPTAPVVEAGATGWIAAHESGRIHHFSIADGWTVEVVTK